MQWECGHCVSPWSGTTPRIRRAPVPHTQCTRLIGEECTVQWRVRALCEPWASAPACRGAPRPTGRCFFPQPWAAAAVAAACATEAPCLYHTQCAHLSESAQHMQWAHCVSRDSLLSFWAAPSSPTAPNVRQPRQSQSSGAAKWGRAGMCDIAASAIRVLSSSAREQHHGAGGGAPERNGSGPRVGANPRHSHCEIYVSLGIAGPACIVWGPSRGGHDARTKVRTGLKA